MIRSSSHPHVQNALSHFRQCAGEKASYLTYGQCRQKQQGHASDENVETCREAGIELISPVAGKSPATATATATGPDTPAGPHPDTKSGGVPPVPPDKPKSRQERLEQRRANQQTEAWKKEYAKRSGQEGVNRALDRVTGIKQLVVRGSKAVTMALYLKTIGWNLLKAGQTYAQRGIAARQMEPQTA